MTEFMAFLLLVAIAAVATSIWLFYRRASREIVRLKEYEFFADRFFSASDALIADADTPEIVLSMLSAINEMIGDERAARRFWRGYEAHHLEARRSNKPPRTRPELREFMQRRQELSKQFADALMSGIMAMTFLGNGWGVRSRALLADAFAREPKPSDVIEVLEHSACLPQAA